MPRLVLLWARTSWNSSLGTTMHGVTGNVNLLFVIVLICFFFPPSPYRCFEVSSMIAFHVLDMFLSFAVPVWLIWSSIWQRLKHKAEFVDGPRPLFFMFQLGLKILILMIWMFGIKDECLMVLVLVYYMFSYEVYGFSLWGGFGRHRVEQFH